MTDNKRYEQEFSDENFWSKIRKYAVKAGKEVIEKALVLYYTSQSPNTPMTAKIAIYGALGYFISPIDAIPDIIPITGYVDDLGVLGLAIKSISGHITSAITTKAENKHKLWFN